MENSKLLELARKQRMSTDVRKNVFLIMMTSEVRILNNIEPYKLLISERIIYILNTCLNENLP